MGTIMDALDKKFGNEKKSMTIAEALGGKNGRPIADVIAEMDSDSNNVSEPEEAGE